ncbi:MAG TPA: ABC transporter permease [Thermoanaerobaculia bacterium]|nr:ABC transporter permease [Thermoanaerobaculia bacterium]
MSQASAASMPGVPALGAPVLVIRPTRGFAGLKLPELWEYRELFYFLVWRDVKVRYKQTALGAAWAVLQPLLTMLIFTIFFGKLAGVGSDGVPYPIFSYAGLLPWTFFAQGVSQASMSLVASANLVKKVYFPRLIVPAASVLAGLVDLFFAFLLLVGLMAWYKVPPPAAVLSLPLFILLALVTALGAGIWLAVLNVEYRDVRYVVPFFIQIWLFVTPVIYPTGKVVAKLAEAGIPTWVYGLNPMAGVVEGFRWALLGSRELPVGIVTTSALVSLVLLVTGAFYFRRMDRTFADVV